ncbi:MAG: glycosyltransferase family 2 protein [Syntrophomonadaceae bacterium]|nr:glycosyltransferase family 2 protein [Syntrophomonadaceae bacterium]
MKIVTFIIPCFNSEKNIPLVVAEIKREFVLRPECQYQLILVNDYSADDTIGAIRELCSEDQDIIGISLSRNFGQQAARMAALHYIKGEYVVFMDDDGEHPVVEIFNMIDKLETGYDVVYASFKDKHYSLIRKMGTALNQKMANMLIGKPSHIKTSSFFVMRRFVAEALKEYHSSFPYLLGYILKITNNIADIEMEHRSRISGESGYTFKKMVLLWLNGFTSFSVRPLRVSTFMGFIMALIGFLFGVFIVINKIMNPAIQAGYTSIIAVMIFIGGMVMLMLGMIGEYIGRIFITMNRIPQFVILETINAEGKIISLSDNIPQTEDLF